LGTPNGGTPNQVTVTSYDGVATPSPWNGGNSSTTGQVSTTADVIVSGVSGCVIATITTDEAGHVRQNCMDGLGRLSAVLEPNGVLTSYTNDVFNNLTRSLTA
jgi:hypothetical protein